MDVRAVEVVLGATVVIAVAEAPSRKGRSLRCFSSCSHPSPSTISRTIQSASRMFSDTKALACWVMIAGTIEATDISPCVGMTICSASLTPAP